MPTYHYTARDATGATTQGTLEAPARRDILRKLQARGLQPVQVNEDGSGHAHPRKPAAAASPSAKAASAANKKPQTRNTKPGGGAAPAALASLTRRERIPAFESLADLIRSGMSAGEAVRLLALRLQHPKLRALFADLWSRLGEGQSLSAALAAHPRVFDPQSINLIAAGEATGNLREVLERLISHLQEQKELRAKIATAMAYPVFICLLATGVILFFLFFLLPRLQTLLGSLGGKLPLATQLLVSGSQFLIHYGIFILAGLAAAAFFGWRWRRTEAGRRESDALLLRTPVVKGYAARNTVLNFAQTLAVLLENGITTADALRLTERTVTNLAIRERLHDATDRVLEGESLSGALGRTEVFPALILDRLSVAEQTGNLAPGLRDIARTCRAEMEKWLQMFMRTISGGVLVVAFSFVAFLAYAIVSAVFQVSSSLRF
ncbi:MAG: type II secretion system F family protein [Opitutaceae bacterium]|jgi:type II secretory pathway component PulF|nr:type II secretion system F family protein [Opitutaceae bacterium]